MAARGRPKGSKTRRPLSQLSQTQLREKIDAAKLLNLLNRVLFEGAEITSAQLTVAKMQLDRVLPVLQSQEIKGDMATFVMRLPEPAEDMASWERTNSVTSDVTNTKDTKH
jgi:hypothetical protein